MSAKPVSRLWIFAVWLVSFYATWLFLVATGHQGHTLKAHWGIAAAMAFGSYAAGSTPLGGGTIGFPVLVLLFHQSPCSAGISVSRSSRSA